MKTVRIVRVEFPDMAGNEQHFDIKNINIDKITQYYAQGDGDRGHINVFFKDGTVIELYNYTRVDSVQEEKWHVKNY